MIPRLPIGIDARVATGFDKKRKQNPEQFRNRMGNKMVYVVEAVNKAFERDIRLYKQVRYFACDGIDYTNKIQNQYKPTFIVLANITSYGGGFNLWGKPNNMPQYCDDRKIEVMVGTRIDFLNHFTLGKHLTRIAQAKEVIIILDDDNYMQIDGEPWFNECSTKITDKNKQFGLKVSYKNSVPMLLGPKEGKMTLKANNMMKIESSPLARTITTNKFHPNLSNMDRKTQSCDQAQNKLPDEFEFDENLDNEVEEGEEDDYNCCEEEEEK